MNKSFCSASVAKRYRWASQTAAKAAKALAICGALLLTTGRVAAQTDGVWSVTTSGSAAGTNLWSTAANWQGGAIANGADGIADFSQLRSTGNATVHLDSPRTIGALVFGDQGNAYNWTLDNNQQAANTLTLATYYFAEPTISVNTGAATISAAIAGNQGFELNSQGQNGTLILSGPNAYSGPTNINSGTLQAGAANAISPYSDISVGGGTTLMLGGFSQTLYTLTGAGSVTNCASTPATLTITGGGAFSGEISDGTTASAGKLSLTLNSPANYITLSEFNTYTGATTINSAWLTLDFSALTSAKNIVSPSSPLVLAGGYLAVNDSPYGAATLQVFNGTTINTSAATTYYGAATPGFSTVAVSANGSSNQGSALVLGALTRTAGGAIIFTLPGIGNITTTTPNTSGIIGPWAIVNGTDWAANSGVPNTAGGWNILACPTYSFDYTDNTAATPTPNFGWGVGNNTAMICTTAATTNAIAAGSTTNSLLFSTSSNYTINLTGANTITSGGILVSSAAANPSITIGGSGSLTVGPSATELNVSNLSNGILTIGAAILDNGSGPTALFFSGGTYGRLALTNPANSYSGVTLVNSGTLQISADHDLGTPPVSATQADIVLMSGSTLQGSGTFTLNSNRGIALLGSGYVGGFVSVLSGTLTYGGVIADLGASPATLVVEGAGVLELTGANRYTGGTLIAGGTLSIASDAALGGTARPTPYTSNVQLEGTLQLASGFSGELSSGRSIAVGDELGSATGTIDTNGNGTAVAPIILSDPLVFGYMAKAGAGVLEIDSAAAIDFGVFSEAGLAVTGGTLRLNSAVAPTDGGGIGGGQLYVSVSAGATLELAGPAPQLAQTTNYSTMIRNYGTLLVSSSVNQTVEQIFGAPYLVSEANPLGATVVNAGASLTAYQILQNSLTIHGTGTTAATAGTVTLVPSGSGSTTNPTGPNFIYNSSTLTSLSIDNNGAPVGSGKTIYYGTLDIGNNGLVIAYGSGPDPYAAIDDMIRSGYANGRWTGTGITSSLAAAAADSNTPLNIGLLDFTPGMNGDGTFVVFEGQTVTTNAILLRLTYMDDLILSGDMSPQDAASDALLFAANYGSGTTWGTGDLTHDGQISTDDALLFAANYAVGLPSLDGATGGDAELAGAVAAVPEPASLGIEFNGHARDRDRGRNRNR